MIFTHNWKDQITNFFHDKLRVENGISAKIYWISSEEIVQFN